MRIHRFGRLRAPAKVRQMTRNKKLASVVSVLALLILGGVGVMIGNTFAAVDYTWQKGSSEESLSVVVNLGQTTVDYVSIDGSNLEYLSCYTMITGGYGVRIKGSCLNNYSVGNHTLVIGAGAALTYTLTITEATEAGYIFDGITQPSAITGVANGTAKTAAALGLPSKVTVSLINASDSSDYSTEQWDVSWDVAGSSYNPSNTSAQTFTVTGTVTLPSNVTNPRGLSTSTAISLSVNAAPTYTYTLSFNANGGSNAPGAVSCTTTGSSCSVTIPSTAPIRAEHAFLGYANSTTAGVAYQPGNTLTLSANKTIYAKWSGPSLSLNNDGVYQKGTGEQAIATPAVNKGAPNSVSIDGVVLRSGQYTFDATTGAVVISSDYLNTLDAGEHTLTIKWSDDTESTITFTISRVGPEIDVDNDGKHEYGGSDSMDVTPSINQGEPEYVKIDGEEIDESCYTTDANTGVVTILPSCLSDLEEGEHTLTIGWSDGTESTTTFIIFKEDVPVPNTAAGAPDTGANGRDGGNGAEAVWMVAGAAVAAMAGVAMLRRKHVAVNFGKK